MKTVPYVAVALLLTFLCAPAVLAQCSPAFTLSTANPNTGQAGVMFDMEPTGGAPLQIESFDVYVSGTANYEVWVRSPLQSFVGFQSTTAGWTLLGTTTVTGAGTGSPVPLNLCLGYILQPGGRTGFYVTTVGGGTHWYFQGTSVGAVWQSDANLTIYHGNSGAYFNATISPRCFGGAIHYGFGANRLDVSQSGPGVGDLNVSLTMISPTATEGWLLLSLQTGFPVATGPLLGIWPDATTFNLFLTSPLIDGNPLHFPIPSPSGAFPNTPFILPPGGSPFPAGVTVDVVAFLVGPNFAYDGRSGVVRYTFQ